ncbi:paraquat-inducible protein A [Pseudooceanicola sp.]|uniref:paraquat-inducible protein A n=1 Tax=Pseudooceanicola sp. TaxID=1914328 RepID=UPI002625B675|nr:paraquat-inducible protein A [Pseudooceanicola sp.]MDF1855592.1 paraquat-inducible protein A [Pseudooceanicola sp.]
MIGWRATPGLTRALILGNLLLLLLYPIAWFAPLLRAGLLPLFGLSEISVWSGVVSLWETDRFLALLVGLFALVAPYAKTLALLGVLTGRWGRRSLRFADWAGRLAMADIFLISLYIAIIKGIGIGRVETGWGIYLFSGCILASLLLARLTETAIARRLGPGAEHTQA